MTRYRFEVPDRTGRLDKLLVPLMPELSRARIQDLIDSGQVTLDGVPCRRSTKPKAGQIVEVMIPEPRPTRPQAEDLPLSIVYQDNDLAVIDKAVGMVVHPAAGHATGTLVNALLFALDDLSGIGGELRPGIVHRLDKGTSGLMVVAKHDLAHRHLQAQFAAHTAGRTYQALVLGQPDLDAGTIKNQLGRHPRDRMRFASVAEGRVAVTHWTVTHRFERAAELECRLETGRTHQIRVHLSEAGWPVLGDPLYARGRTPPPAIQDALVEVDHQLLHARRLELEHPSTGQRMSWEVAPPEHFSRVRAALR